MEENNTEEFQLQQRLKAEALSLQAKRTEEEARRQAEKEKARVEDEIRKKKAHEDLVTRINAGVLTTVLENDPEELTKLLEGGADVNVENHLKRTPLTLAVLKDDVQLVRILLSYGANVGSTDLYGQTPMSFAVKYKRHGCLELLAQSQKGNAAVGGFMYQRRLEQSVKLHKQDMERKKIEQEKLDLMYKSSRVKKPSLKEQYGLAPKSPSSSSLNKKEVAIVVGT